ncbi:hypothetical protein B0T19DRAFT_397174 [Cercophora scortea]|uniref:Cellobiose dehydrogenase-like cytochrome domain-containing protein n=1 Tax=Cercophora scortea TaxID=314031 RepID=A0AAE0J5X8_9PEZI|nr:hypothetical protein B0T19DRAFT_397174 [Cercophora scortea]
MMGIKHLALLALSSTQISSASARASDQAKRQDVTQKYCPGGTSICFSEYTVATHNIVYRIAIPEVTAAPFDILLQIVAPKAVGWAGLAWGGKMSNNPLTIAWPNGNSALVSSRFTTAPGAYTGATYTILPSTTSNATHWQLDVLAVGASQWAGGSLDPNGPNALAWAKSSKAVTTASSNTSAISAHDAKAVFAHDFSQAKIPKGVFDALAYDLGSSAPSSSSSPSSAKPPPATTSSSSAVSSAAPPTPTTLSTVPKPPVVVTTRVTTLPKPTTSPIPDYPLTTTALPPAPSTVTVIVTAPAPAPTPTTWVPPFLPPWLGHRPPWRWPPAADAADAAN